MTRKLTLIFVLGSLLIGCKTKHRVTYNKKKTETVSTSAKKEASITDDGLYPMPEDSGNFVRFEINNVQEYIDTFSEVAQFEMKAYGIPASITLAQGLLESGFGRGELAMKTNNHFGIKCHNGWQGDYDFHDDDEKGECFRKYNHPMYSYRDHSIFLTSRSRYASLFDLRNTDYKKWANGLKKAGYATDKKYPHKLISLIERYDLTQYDRQIARAGYGRSNRPVVVDSKRTPSMNRNMVHTVKKGDTLYSISKRYSVSIDDLKHFNSVYTNNISVGQKLKVPSQKFK